MRTSLAVLMIAAAALAGCSADHSSTTASPSPSPSWSPGVAESADAVHPAPVGADAPTDVLRTVDGETFDLAAAYAASPTVLVFYRGGWCPYCNRHLADLARMESELNGMGVQLLAISPDHPGELRKTLTDKPLGYTLLSDSDMALSRAFGLAFRVDDATLTKYDEYGIDLEAAAGGLSHHLLPVPAVYVVDRRGVIRFAHWDANYRERLDGDAVLAAARQALGK